MRRPPCALRFVALRAIVTTPAQTGIASPCCSFLARTPARPASRDLEGAPIARPVLVRPRAAPHAAAGGADLSVLPVRFSQRSRPCADSRSGPPSLCSVRPAAPPAGLSAPRFGTSHSSPAGERLKLATCAGDGQTASWKRKFARGAGKCCSCQWRVAGGLLERLRLVVLLFEQLA